MSCRSWSVDGYGMSLENADTDKFMAFIREIASDKLKKQIEEAEQDSDGEEYDWNFLYETFDCNPASVIADYLNEKYGTAGFAGNPQDEDYTPDNLLYQPVFPWEAKEGDRSMTFEKLDEIFDHVAEKLGIEEPDISLQDYEYCG